MDKKHRTVGQLCWQEQNGDVFADIADQPQHADQLAADKWLSERLTKTGIAYGSYKLVRVVKVVTPKVETKTRVRLGV